MNACTMPGCQTTAGCICDRTSNRTSNRLRSGLAAFTDDEIAREYHARMLRKLGDPRIAVTGPRTTYDL